MPVEGLATGNTWPKSQVKPVLLVKPGITSFVPREGTTIGNIWGKQEILPVMLVEPSGDGFVPLGLLTTGGESTSYPSPSIPGQTSSFEGQQRSAPLSPSVIESQVEGDFEGWEGKTVVKLTNGPIWLQTEYYYQYHYAFMPKVLIFKSGNEYKMRVDGVNRPVGVTRLR